MSFKGAFSSRKSHLAETDWTLCKAKERQGTTFHKATCHYHAKWERMRHAKFIAATTSLLTGGKLAIPENCSFYTTTQHHRRDVFTSQNISAHIKQQVLREAWKLCTVYCRHDSIPGAGCVIFTPAAQLGLGGGGEKWSRCSALECGKVPCSTQIHI